MTANSWRELASCHDYDPELWFPVSIAGPAKAQARRAQEICAGCPVRKECLEWALAAQPRIHNGIWGGVWFEQIAARQYSEKRRAAREGRPARCIRPPHRHVRASG